MASEDGIGRRGVLPAIRAAWGAALAHVRIERPGQIQFWFIALVVGLASGMAALLFRKAVDGLQTVLYRTEDVTQLATSAANLPWYLIVLWPVLGGLVVGLLLHRFTDDGRARSVAEVIEGAAMREGRIETRAGWASAAASVVTLAAGGSTGREGPVVHMAALISTWVSRRLSLAGLTARDLLGCAVAAGVSASFNAPIAGALFALEVVLRHFAIHAFAPIVVASAAGTVINRLEFGGLTEFRLDTASTVDFYQELPAFLLLGLVCGLVAVVMMRAIFWTDGVAGRWQDRLGVPRWLRPAGAGVLLGLIAIPFPHIIGVGYETTSLALTGQLTLGLAVAIAVAKVAAVAITMGGRMAGGVFSPSLMLGSLVGLAFGLLATGVFPDHTGGPTLYALAGMGAVAASVLGAPISTTLIVFELTGDWQTGLAVMVSVSTATAVSSKLVSRSFFLTQLERRGVHVAAGPQAYLLSMFRVANVMRRKGAVDAPPDDAIWEAIESGLRIEPDATLSDAMPLFEHSGRPFLPVVRMGAKGEAPEILGALYHVDALKRYNRALAATAAEEHA